MRHKAAITNTLTALTLLSFSTFSIAQDDEATALAKETQNPIANIISVPVMNNINFGAGADNHVQNTMNIQPVIPTALNENILLINRLVIPLLNDTVGTGDQWGLGDIQYQGFFSPQKGGDLTWGIGPVMQFPTATDDLLGSGKWSAGAGAVAVKTQGKWVYGGLINNIWSFAGDSDRADVNLMFIQPFANYNLGKGLAIGCVPQITANWKADSGNTWTIPLGLQVSKLKPIGKQPINWTVGGYYNIEKPKYAADWTLRLQMQFIFPK